ncbi:Signal recognition particle subunit SRP68 [Nymphon striatum]|nr:Signal recognition particle subunit SRP68 [Nymphon striatum]
MSAGRGVINGGVFMTSPQADVIGFLQIIKDAQQQHGLRHGDYQRYRGYCSRRLRRLRKSLHFFQGTKHRVVPKKVTDEVLAEVRFLYIPLFMAERAWSYAMQLKQEANTEPRKRFHLISRLHKAAKHTQQLEDVCKSEKCDARTKLEAQAYNGWMQGCLQFELHDWKTALEKFRKAKTIYEKLGNTLVDEEKSVYVQRVDELSPNIRYCEYNIGDESAINDLKKMRLRATPGEDIMSADLDALISQTREKQTATLSTVTWMSRTVSVKHEKVRLFLLNVQECENEVGKSSSLEGKISLLDSLLMECKDSIQLLRDELKFDPTFKNRAGQVSSSGTPNDSAIHLYNYLVYIRLTKTVDRNLLMIDSLKKNLPDFVIGNATTSGDKKSASGSNKVTKPQDVIRLYETNLQNLTEVHQMLEEQVDEDADLMRSLLANTYYNKAFRCFYIAQVFTSMNKWSEALALYSRVEKYVDDCFKSSTKFLPKMAMEELKVMVGKVNANKYSLHAMSFINMELQDSSTSVKQKRKTPLSEHLDEYYDVPTDVSSESIAIAKFPPDYQPIACKPLFFDLALNHVQFPSLEDKLEQKKGGQGLTGMVKGWLWGGSSKK